MKKIHLRLENGNTLCGTAASEKDERWNWVTCRLCLKRRAKYEEEAARLHALKNTQEVLVEMTIPLAEWEDIGAQLLRAQRIHEIMGGMQPALSMLIAQLKKAHIVTRPVSNLAPKE